MADVTEKTTTTTTTGTTPKTRKAPGLSFRRYFTQPDISPYDALEWELRTAQITDAEGNVIFEQKDVEVPKDWSMTATNIAASKYLHGRPGTSERETGVRQLVSRVAETIRDWGTAGGYFRSNEDAAVFHDELCHILLRQMAAFNSPVWFNVGCDRIEPSADGSNWHWNPLTQNVEFAPSGYRNPQCSACFINSVKDSMDSIMNLAKTEAMLFKWGSGTGTNLSPLRASHETLSGGGTASGPLSFMRGFDAFAGVIKSGGKTRRAAKMVILNIDHPDVPAFIDCKMTEEKKAHALIREGYDGSNPDSPAYSSIFFQNANNSVRVTDEFMLAVERDADFTTHNVQDSTPHKTYKARDLLRKIAEATWHCGDPGMQFDTTVNRWHTSKNTGRINASNPCSEYMFLDDSACNLSSLNLMKFARYAGAPSAPGSGAMGWGSGTFDIEAYRYAVDIMITAQEILVDFSGYPTESIARNSHDYRPLGLGYANLGALLMASGLPYDSEAGRDYAACVTAIMCGEAYLQSARIAEFCPALEPAGDRTKSAFAAGDRRLATGDSGGAAPGFYLNREAFLDVIRMHRASVNSIGSSSSVSPVAKSLVDASKQCWDEALSHGEKFGYRNAQVTVLAPTGTIGFLMDCDTTGIEPDLALVKFKKLVGGGLIKIVNNTVPAALFKLGYATEQVSAIVSYIDATGTIEGAPHIKDEHLAVFDCSFKPSKGTRSIHYMGHLRMMAATQPFISGAISKTVNLPEAASVEEIAEVYIQAWKLGLKSVAIYRDGCKKSQPMVVKGDKEKEVATGFSPAAPSPVLAPAPVSAAPAPEHPIDERDADGPPLAHRNRLHLERASLTHKFNIAGHEGYITVGVYPSGQPGEIFITMAKEGSTVSGLMDSFALAISMALQHGVPLKLLCEKFKHTRFEPSGWTGNENIGYATSVMDYIFRWLEQKFVTGQQQLLFPGMRVPPHDQPALPENGVASVAQAPGSPSRAGFARDGVEVPSPAGSSSATRDSGLGSRSPHPADLLKELVDMGDAPACSFCGSIMTRNGSCFRCQSCGSTSGCS